MNSESDMNVSKNKNKSKTNPIKYFKKFPPRKKDMSKISFYLKFFNNLKAVKNKNPVMAEMYNICSKLAVPNCSDENVGSVKTSGIIPIQQNEATHSQVPNIPSKIISFPPLIFYSTFEKCEGNVLIFLALKTQGVLLASR